MNDDNDFLLFDRVEKIKDVFNQYGIENFCISYSGGKDSSVLSTLIDIVVPDNKIPRVFMHTGIELNSVVNFVRKKSEEDTRFHIITPKNSIKKTLEKYGYPFKSKEHSEKLSYFQNGCLSPWIFKYVLGKGRFSCPETLKFQFDYEYKLKISDKCCLEMKEKPLDLWKEKTGYKYHIIGIRRAEGGRRSHATCLAFDAGKLRAFQPLAPVDDGFIEYMVEQFNIELPEVYYPPYNFKRTGCKGCPFGINLQNELDVLEKYFPEERKQCEIIWKPVYDEYRRLGYRLRKED